jgi:hypothetical protein
MGNDTYAAWRQLFMINNPLKIFMQNNVIFGNILQPYIELNNRKCGRDAIGKGVYALMSWNVLKNHFLLGQLIDINKVGCGIYYVADRSKLVNFLSQKTCKLRFIGSFKMFELKKNTVVYDNELIEHSTERISVRRCGVKFDDFVKVSHLS